MPSRHSMVSLAKICQGMGDVRAYGHSKRYQISLGDTEVEEQRVYEGHLVLSVPEPLSLAHTLPNPSIKKNERNTRKKKGNQEILWFQGNI